jgi:hypothetical protein
MRRARVVATLALGAGHILIGPWRTGSVLRSRRGQHTLQPPDSPAGHTGDRAMPLPVPFDLSDLPSASSERRRYLCGILDELDPEAYTRITALTMGDPDLERHLAQRYGCAGFHTIPGVPGAQGRMGRPSALRSSLQAGSSNGLRPRALSIPRQLCL